MEHRYSTSEATTRPRRSRTGARIIAIFTAAAATVALTPAAPGIAATAAASAARTAPASPESAHLTATRLAADRLAAAAPEAVSLAGAPEEGRLARLERKAKALAKEYRGEVVRLTEARQTAQRAAVRAKAINTDLTRTRARVAQLAARSYMTGGVDQVPLAFSTDPQSVIDSLGLHEYLARQNGARVQNLTSLTAEATKAKRTASSKVDEVGDLVSDLERQRKRVKALLKKFKAQKAARSSKKATAATGASASTVLKAKSPLTGDFMTARMRRFYLEVDSRFGPFKSVGCHRPGDPQDHGTGNACDFMVSFGTMPSASGVEQCDRASQFAIDNASRLGLKYVIWQQRIYDVRNPGWRQMEDRGSITQNHFDHCHISVL